MNLTIRFGRMLVGAAVLGAILTPATVASAQVGPDDITDDPCQPELEDCSPDPCDEAVEIPFRQSLVDHPENDECPGPDPCLEGEEAPEGDECPPDLCIEDSEEAECPDEGPDPDPDPDPYDPPVVGEPNFTG
ncbi:MAG: hypothetical protein ACRD2C_00425 [Acidimicrobiales bacterium]